MDPSEQTELDLRQVFGVIRRQSRLILATILVVVAAALLYAVTVTPLYRAEALILVDPAEQNLLDPTQQGSLNGNTLNARVDSEVEILRSQAMALAVVEAANLIADPEFGPRLSTRERLLQAIGVEPAAPVSGARLLNDVVTRFEAARDVRRSGLTYIIAVGVTAEDPARAARLANALAQTYIDQQVRAKVVGALAARDVLNGQIATAQDRLARSEERLDSFIFDNLDRLDDESGADEIAALRGELAEIERTRANRAELTGLAEEALALRDWTSLARLLEDEALAELERERRDLAARLAGADDDDAPAFDLRAALDQLDADLETRAGANLSGLRADLEEIDAEAGRFRDEIRSTLLRSDLSSNTLAEVFTLRQEAELSRQQYRTLLARLSQLETEALVQVADSRIVSQALPPNEPDFPNTGLILVLALVVSAALGLGLAFANEFYVGGVTSDTQLASLVQVPVAATVPKQAVNGAMTSVADLVATKPLSAYSEVFRHLRASLDQGFRARDSLQDPATGGAGGKVILFSSSIPAEGKSTAALALARTYAIFGKRTILIDADLRKPSLAQQLATEPEGSMLEYLQGELPDEEELSFYALDPASSLLVFLSRGRSDLPTDQLLVSSRFAELVDAARESADIVIIDSPPILPVVDARYIVHHADAVLMVTRFALTTQSDIRRAAAQIRDAMKPGAILMGILSHREGVETAYRNLGETGYATE
jgi:succinoglycan biosynthesis transport protein ExoP